MEAREQPSILPGRAKSLALAGFKPVDGIRFAALAIWLCPRPGWFELEIDRRRLFLWIPVCFGLGIIAYFQAEIEPGMIVPALAFAGATVTAFMLREYFRARAAAVAVAAFLGGFLAGIARTSIISAPVLVSPVFASVDGWIENIDWNVYGGRMIIRVADMTPAVETMPMRIRLTFRGRPKLESGFGIRVRARLSPPNRAAVPGGFDFQREAFFQRLGAVGFSTGSITVLPDIGAPPLRARLAAAIDHQRNVLTERIISVVGGSTGAIAAALVTGKRGQIADSDNDNMRAAGIYHIVSISGLHMVLAAGLFFWGARMVLVAIPGFASRRPAKKWAAAFAMTGAVAYNVFSGSEVATERSLIMTLVIFGAILFDRPALAMRNLAISGLLIMLVEPETVLGPSFQMSFGAVAGLIAYGEIERQRRILLSEKNTFWSGPLFRWLLAPTIGILMTTFIAGLATAPFQAFHFHRLNPFGVLGNALAIPLCSFVVMPSALLGVILLPFGLDAPVWWVMGKGVSGIQEFAAWVAALDGSVAVVRRFGEWTLGLMTLGILFTTFWSTALLRASGVALIVAGTILAKNTNRPDLILDPSGQTALLRGEDGRMVLLGPKRPGFALQQWLPGDQDIRGPRDISLTNGALCDKLGCVARLPDGKSVSIVLDVLAFTEDCERAAIIITGLRAPEACWTSADVYDRSFFESYGATYLYRQKDGWRLETARNERIDRPWSPKPVQRTRDKQPVILDPATASPPMPSQAWDSQSADEPQ